MELAYYLTSYAAVVSIVCIFLTNAMPSQKAELLQHIPVFGCIFALPLLKKYDGSKGPSCKIFSYVYYLGLLGVIVLIKLLK